MSDILDSIEVTGDNAKDFNDELDELDFDDEGNEGDVVELLSDDDLEFEMSEAKAREITDAISAAATATYVLLAQAHQGKAYKALGYSTWADYVREEFDISASRSYQLLDLSKVVREIEEATPEGTVVRLTEAQARDIKRELPKITERIREEVDGLDAEEASNTVERIIEDIREQKKADEAAVQEREQKLSEAEQNGYHRGLEAAADAFLENNNSGGPYEGGGNGNGGEYGADEPGVNDGLDVMSPQDKVDLYNFLNVLSGLTSLPDPDDFVKIVPAGREEEISNQLNIATSWINRFSSLWEVRAEEG